VLVGVLPEDEQEAVDLGDRGDFLVEFPGDGGVQGRY